MRHHVHKEVHGRRVSGRADRQEEIPDKRQALNRSRVAAREAIGVQLLQEELDHQGGRVPKPLQLARHRRLRSPVLSVAVGVQTAQPTQTLRVFRMRGVHYQWAAPALM